MKNLVISFLLIVSIRVAGQSNYYITSADGTKLYVQEFGGGEPLIILAGGPALNAVYMKPIWDSLSAMYRCIVLDQRGSGNSKLLSVDSVTVNLNSYVNDLEALRKYLKLGQLTLIGHSWGGMLAMEYASRYPENLKKIIMLDPGGPTEKFFDYFGDNIMMRLRDEDIREMDVLDSLNQSDLKAIWPGYFYDRKRALATKSSTDIDKLVGQPQIGKFLLPSYFAGENERTKRLKNYKGIVDIIQGRQDPIGESTIYEIKELLPQSRIYFIERCGHLPWLENTEQIRNFFEALYSSLN